MRYLKPEDVFGVRCPCCKTEIEFFKDDPSLRCPTCGNQVRNPRIDPGCAGWCALAEQCLARDENRIDHICRIGGSHGAGDIDTPESRIVRDAVRAAKIYEE